MTAPLTLTSGPPELPGLIAASVWMKSWMLRSLVFGSASVRPFALMMPDVTVKVRFSPSGLPTASTHSPTRERVAVAERGGGQVVGVDLEHGEVGAGIGADDLGLELPPVEQPHRHLVGAVHHVIVGEDVAVLADDEAGARRSPGSPGCCGIIRGKNCSNPGGTWNCGPVGLPLRLARLDEHHARLDVLGHRGERLAQARERRRAGRRRGRGRGGHRRGRVSRCWAEEKLGRWSRPANNRPARNASPAPPDRRRCNHPCDMSCVSWDVPDRGAETPVVCPDARRGRGSHRRAGFSHARARSWSAGPDGRAT